MNGTGTRFRSPGSDLDAADEELAEEQLSAERSEALSPLAPIILLSDRLRVLLTGPLDTRRRHEIGALIAQAKRAPETYGIGAVAQLAGAVGEDIATLYRHASVAERWTASEVELLVVRGQGRLSWSHLVHIAAVDSAGDREVWLERVRVERLSVRQLGMLLAALPAPSDREDARARLERAVTAAERFVREAEALGEELMAEDVPPRLLERAIAVHERVQRLADARLQHLKARATRAPVANVRRQSGAMPRLIAGHIDGGRRSQR